MKANIVGYIVGLMATVIIICFLNMLILHEVKPINIIISVMIFSTLSVMSEINILKTK